MLLPPVDQLRQTLIEPLGHLVLQAAYLDEDICFFLGMMKGDDVNLEEIAHELRNWSAAQDYIDNAVSASIPDVQLASDIRNFLKRVGERREQRNRMIHDAMGVGVGPDTDGKLQTFVLRTGFVRVDSRRTYRTVAKLDAEDVAALARDFYNLRLEIDSFIGRWRDISKQVDGGPAD